MDVSASGYQNQTKKHYSNMLNPPQRNGENGSDTLPQTNSSPLKINCWKMIRSFGFRSIFGGGLAVSFGFRVLFQSWWNQRCPVTSKETFHVFINDPNSGNPEI